ncbi:tetratricopeptide repeat protein [bacterium]|nr:tetratricopeptide repeat protein [bacterium]
MMSGGAGPEPRATSGRSSRLAAILAPGLAAAALYAASLGKPFMWDDLPFILYDESIRSIKNIPSFFATDQHGLYRPIRPALAALWYAAFEYSPVAWRALAVSLHAGATIAFAWMLTSLGAAPRLAGAAALIFAVHPVHADRAANTAGALDLPGIALTFAAVALFARGRKGKDVPALAAALAVSLAAMLASEEAVTIPAYFAAWFWISPPPGSRAIQSTSPARIPLLAYEKTALAYAAALTAMYIALRAAVIGRVARVDISEAPPLLDRVATALPALAHGLAKVVVPFALRPAYETPARTPSSPAFWFTGVLLVCGLVYLFRRRAGGSWIALGLAFALVALLPFSQIVASDTVLAERYLYAALGGLALCGAALFLRLLDAVSGPRRAFTLALGVAAIGLFAAHTLHRTHVWSHSALLWTDAYIKDDRSVTVLSNLGTELYATGDIDGACSMYARATRSGPRAPEAYIGLGDCAIQAGDRVAARRHFLTAYRQSANRGSIVGALEGLAQLDAMDGRWVDAGRRAEELQSYEPESLVARYVLGYIHLRQGKIEIAYKELSAVADAPHAPERLAEAARGLLSTLNRGEPE